MTWENILINKMNRFPLFLSLGLLFVCAYAYAEDSLDQAVNTTIQTNDQSAKTQENIDQLDDSTRDMLQEYRNTLQQLESIKTYNAQLEKLIGKQSENLKTIKQQMNSVDETQQNIVPMMLKMVDVLDQFISLDIPFHHQERSDRINSIKELMDRPDVSLPEKYRRVMEAYQIEMEYGRTIDTYTDNIIKDGKNYTVNILRIGRLALLFQTMDEKESGYWDNEDKKWKDISTDYNESISQGILMAKKQAPPDFFTIPVAAPEHQQ